MEKRQLKLATSWDDGDIDDLKIAELLLEFELPGVFYVPNTTEIPDIELAFLGSYFELGGHTVTHPEDLKRLSFPELEYELSENKKWLESFIGRPVKKFAYPGGRYNENTIIALKKAGFEEARTTIVLRTEPRDPFRVDTTIHIYPRREYKGRPWMDVAKEQALFAAQTRGTFHIWSHAEDLNQYGEWDRLREFFAWVKDNFEIIKS